jgi:5'(3')-deoxyribonucleotidase
MTKRPLRIAVDMDEVIADSDGKQLRLYNQRFGQNLTVTDLGGRALEDFLGPERAPQAHQLLFEPDFYVDLEVIPGSQEVVSELAERNEVFIATAAMEIPTSFAAKFAWLRRHFPFIPPSHLVFCGDKGVLDMDVLIDDSPRHFRRFRGTPILFATPYNQRPENSRFIRVQRWPDVRQVLGQAVRQVLA